MVCSSAQRLPPEDLEDEEEDRLPPEDLDTEPEDRLDPEDLETEPEDLEWETEDRLTDDLE